jgi:hypothetical protein
MVTIGGVAATEKHEQAIHDRWKEFAQQLTRDFGDEVTIAQYRGALTSGGVEELVTSKEFTGVDETDDRPRQRRKREPVKLRKGAKR